MTALAYDAYFGLFRLMPISTASAVGGWLFRTIGSVMPVNKVARRNIQIVFPNASRDQEREIIRGMWDNLGRLVGEFPHLPELVTFGPEGRVEVEGAERFEEAKRNGAAVFVSGHLANWEIMASVIVRHGVPCHVTYRQMNNGFMDDRIAALRSAYGVKMMAAKGKTGGISLMRALAKGETVAIMNDQKYNEGVASSFFGTEVMTADGASRLARRFDCPIVPMSIERLPKARFKVRVHEPITVRQDVEEAVAIRDAVERINRFIEERVAAAPEQWFWVHRRWAKAIYRGEDPTPRQPFSAPPSETASEAPSSSSADATASGSSASATAGSM